MQIVRRAPLRRNGLLLAGAALMGAGGVSPVSAQDVDNDDEDKTSVIHDIVVTAERRAMNLQDTPLSIVAVNEEMVEARGIEDLEDLANQTPNLSIAPQRGGSTSTPSFTIRGIGGGGGALGERGVGLYIDGIYMPRTAGSVLKVIDIDRIEVLRGPQGTLFGRNSTGGAVRYFTKQPRLGETEGYAQVTAGNYDRADIVGAINIPIGDTLAVRAQGAYLHQGGWVQRGTEKNGASTDYVGRVQARFEPNDRFEATLGFLYTDSRANGSPIVTEELDLRPGIEPAPGFVGIQGNYGDWLNDAFKSVGQAPIAPYNDPRVVTGDKYRQHDICLLDDFNPDFGEECVQRNTSVYWQADLRMSYELSDDVTLSSTSGLSKLDFNGVIDYQQLGTENRKLDTGSKVFYQELQLNAAPFGGALDVVGGLNYFYEKSDEQGLTITRKGTSVYPNSPNGNADGGLVRRQDADTTQVANSFGAFVSATWHVTDRLNFTGGLRYAYDRKRIESIEYASSDFTPAPGTTSTFVDSSRHWQQVDYRATIDYKITPDILAYATISKAYKAGLYSFSIADNIPGPAQSGDGVPTVPPETVRNYEVGLRMALFNRAFIVNPTVFYMQWGNRQSARRVTCTTGPSCPLGFNLQVVDAGDIDVYGLELDSRLRLSRNFSLDASGSLTGVKLDPVRNGGPFLFPDIPRKQLSLGGTLNVPAEFGEFTVNMNWSYTDDQATLNLDNPDSKYQLPAYSLVNARVRFMPKNVPVVISVFANNLFDKTYATGATRFGGAYFDSFTPTGVGAPPRNMLSVVRGKPRMIGASIRYDF
ncbi:iron complex outermembrane receptor protein [Sphingobium sp. B1D7B]|uniref:TonB-dependent receptor n=1 Tax=Sphingobium sp. B1D7B TaxID=2940578 RepID=UPI0022257933|nr:TonB-dependent receptor [Sphingobium sp. B1D7B]MCW2403647.1 iron complex outermembrane receptor protein [Sphingobium sp. B1D7B]